MSHLRIQDDWPLHLGPTGDLYSDGLRQLAAALKEKYDPNHLSRISYALAVNFNGADTTDPAGTVPQCRAARVRGVKGNRDDVLPTRLPPRGSCRTTCWR